MSHLSHLLVVAPLVGLVSWFIVPLAKRAFRYLPPGPKGLPFIGDVKHASDQSWLASPQRKDDYGDTVDLQLNLFRNVLTHLSGELMYLSVFGQGILVVNSQRVAVDLLEKRSNIYSDRPRYISFNEFLTENLTFAFTGYGDLYATRHSVFFLRLFPIDGAGSGVLQWKASRNLSYQTSTPSRVVKAIMLALSLMKSSLMKKHFQRHAWSIILSINYHLPPVESEDDPVIVGVVNHVERAARELRPGARLVEYFPWMRYVPSRFAKWKRDAQYWFIQDSLRHEPLLSKVADDLAKGIDQPSFGATLIKNQGKYHLSERERAWLVGDMLSAGGNTTSTTLHWWLLALLAHPEVQVLAQAELDEVVGCARPPTFADLPSLPYIRAMVKEALRWSPTAPFGVPRASSADDWYEGMFIPKGTIIFPNMRVINFETAVFGVDSARFNPARYLDEKGRVKVVMEGREEGHMTFGYGRRVCPGRLVAEGTLGIDFATLLWALRFERPEGAQGELDVHTLVHTGIGANGHPAPFECKAVPRFAEAEVLLKEALNLYE
ncbi:cytochrome P450 [Lactarius akahatsu]|uniref:Cytochrome P450 n=1 Tax=Lactarius akahatsu TaxID=416441 RepID=A0AAD4Q9F7_9AGAM|nr:cytochrome P450 [Lactarius akahatsu]